MHLQAFRLNDWIVHPELNRAERGMETIHLEPKIVDVLVYLVANAGVVVSRDELMHEIWSDTVVLSDSLNRCISQIRSSFASGDYSRDSTRESPAKVIETIRKRGYRLIADVSYIDSEGKRETQNDVDAVGSQKNNPLSVTFSLPETSALNWYHSSWTETTVAA